VLSAVRNIKLKLKYYILLVELGGFEPVPLGVWSAVTDDYTKYTRGVVTKFCVTFI
jgi:hypothetical protein